MTSRPLTPKFPSLPWIPALVAIAAACSAPAAPAATPLPTPITVVAERDGVRVALAIDRDRLNAGQPLRARMIVTNFEPRTVFWQGGGCDLLNDLSVAGPPQPEPEHGRAWGGEPGVLKSVTISTSPLGFIPPEALEQPDVAFGCPADLRVNELKPGESAQADAVWPATSELGLPVAGGRYVVKASFPFLDRLASGPFDGDPFTDARPIVVETRVEVAPPPAAISPYVATDRILADARFSTWLATVPRQRWLESRLRYANGTWTLTLRLSAPDERGIVTVDATTGAVGELRVVPGS